MSALRDHYEVLRDGGTSHADALDSLVVTFKLDRQAVGRALDRAGVFEELERTSPRPRSRAEELEAARPWSAKGRRARDRARERERKRAKPTG